MIVRFYSVVSYNKDCYNYEGRYSSIVVIPSWKSHVVENSRVVMNEFECDTRDTKQVSSSRKKSKRCVV